MISFYRSKDIGKVYLDLVHMCALFVQIHGAIYTLEIAVAMVYLNENTKKKKKISS